MTWQLISPGVILGTGFPVTYRALTQQRGE